MDDKLNAERLRALDEAATVGPWAYRPELHDDWGVVRAGRYWICQAKNPEVWSDDQLAQHRAARTDPWQGNAELIAYLRNAVPAILAMAEDNARLREALGKVQSLEITPLNNCHAAARNGKELIRARSIARRALAKENASA